MRLWASARVAADSDVDFAAEVLGTRHFSAGRYNDALAQLRLAEQLSARNPDGRLECGIVACRPVGVVGFAVVVESVLRKQYRSYVNRAQRNDPNLPLATYNLGYALFGRREYAAARDRLVCRARSERAGGRLSLRRCGFSSH